MSAPALDAVLALLAARPATLGEGRWLSLDGPAGSGKTTLAATVTQRVPGARVVAMARPLCNADMDSFMRAFQKRICAA